MQFGRSVTHVAGRFRHPCPKESFVHRRNVTRSHMTHRRSPNIAAAARAWDRFVSANAPIIAASGIPRAYLASADHFDDFLQHGHLGYHADDTDFRIESIDTD